MERDKIVCGHVDLSQVDKHGKRDEKKKRKENVGVISATCLLKIGFYLFSIANPTIGGRGRHKSGRIAIIWCLSLPSLLPFFFYYHDH